MKILIDGYEAPVIQKINSAIYETMEIVPYFVRYTNTLDSILYNSRNSIAGLNKISTKLTGDDIITVKDEKKYEEYFDKIYEIFGNTIFRKHDISYKSDIIVETSNVPEKNKQEEFDYINSNYSIDVAIVSNDNSAKKLKDVKSIIKILKIDPSESYESILSKINALFEVKEFTEEQLISELSKGNTETANANNSKSEVATDVLNEIVEPPEVPAFEEMHDVDPGPSLGDGLIGQLNRLRNNLSGNINIRNRTYGSVEMAA